MLAESVRLEVSAWLEARAPHEAGGLVLEGPGGEQTFVPLPNASPTPERAYQADPLALLEALRAAEANGARVLAVCHSHVEAPAWPSGEDVAELFPGGRPAWPGACLLLGEVRGGAVRVLRCFAARAVQGETRWVLDVRQEWLSDLRF
jgi:proteasome lid subunit RPN8/RPN11